jgi:pyruvate/2-oxoglutarate dehydrogenase complex dihydrolipoamide dehydrogenase (E3) component
MTAWSVTNLGVDVVKGYAKIIDPWTVEIARNDGGTQRLTTRSIIIASGASRWCRRSPASRAAVT